MGFFDKIKDMFSKGESEPEKEAEIETLDINDFKSWLGNENKKNDSTIAEKERHLRSKIMESIARLRSANDALKKFDLSKRKEHDRVKLIVDENRNAYSMFLDKLISRIEGIIDEDMDAKERARKISDELHSFGEQTAKSHSRANLLIGKEVENTVIELRGTDKLCRAFLDENKSLFERGEKLEELGRTVDEINNRASMKEKARAELEAKTSEMRGIDKRKKEFEGQIGSLRKMEGFKEYEGLIEKKGRIEDNFRELSEKIMGSVNLKALERYLHDREKDNLAEMYLEDPVSALMQDKEIAISRILGEVKENLEKGRYKMDEKKKERMISSIMTDEGHFKGLRDGLINASAEKEILRSEILRRRSEIGIDKIEEGIKKSDEMLKNVEKGISEAKIGLEFEKGKLGSLVRKLNEEIKSLGENINVSDN
jgi:hypothetical protein